MSIHSEELSPRGASHPQNLYHLLQAAAEGNGNSIIIYPPGLNPNTRVQWTYADLLQSAQAKAKLLTRLRSIEPCTIVLLHFDQHCESIQWFWASVIAGYLPATSTPFVQDFNARRKHISHLNKLLQQPLVLTTKRLLSEFADIANVHLQTVEDLALEEGSNLSCKISGHMQRPQDRAVLMLTSGSTGNAKAVSLRHGQILAAIQGKARFHETGPGDVFLNWIGLDHVANLLEVHLQAMWAGSTQVHVQATDLLLDPTRILSLIQEHQVSYTFAPNFFLASLVKQLAAETAQRELDTSSLKKLISGGEAIVVETANSLTKHIRRHGGSLDRCVVRPGFGMTETCAGSIYSIACPSYDLEHDYEFASLGKCIPGMQMRVVTDEGVIGSLNEVGMLQVRGKVVFSDYYNNLQATNDSFTADGWFITGDRAMIDRNGNLNLAGREKESIIVNGVKYFPHELETALEEDQVPGLTRSYTVVFPYRPQKAETEKICVVYLPSYDIDDAQARSATKDAINKVSAMICGVKPYKIIPVDQVHLPKSSLGKISRSKVRIAFEGGVYKDLEDINERLIRNHRLSLAQQGKPLTLIEKHVLELFAKRFEIAAEEIGTTTSLFDYGMTSVDIISLKRQLEQQLNLAQEIPVITILTNPTVGQLSAAIEAISKPQAYNPVVPLQPRGHKTPLFLVHPGVGEVLVFLNLSRCFTERPVYALRARGFNPGEEFFGSIPEIVDTYKKAIKIAQPHGPYAIAGYSFGAMLAFEIAKALETEGESVPFLGSFNLPPHIKHRMKQLDWTEVILNLAYFLELVPEAYAREHSPRLHNIHARSEVLDQLMQDASIDRLHELSLGREQLENWASLAHSMQYAATEYEPSGRVKSLDVFVATPLAGVARDKNQWRDEKLGAWKGFCEDVKFHDVDGAHYTMMNLDHVQSFQRTLKKAMRGRGL